MANAELDQSEKKSIYDPETKLWGIKEILDRNGVAQLDFLIINKGGYSSKHKHFQKYNLFYVIAGVLKITLYLKNGEQIDYIIGDDCPKRKFIIRPGTFHRFTALEDTECVEYSFVKIVDEDILREDFGGCNN